MKFLINLGSALVLANSAGAFLSNHHSFANLPKCGDTRLKMSSAEDEVAALRAAAKRAREEAQRLARELGKDIDVMSSSSTKTTAKEAPKPSLSKSEVQSLLTSINFQTDDAVAQVEKMNSLVESNNLAMWKGATKSIASLRPYPVTLSALEQRTSGKITGSSLGVSGEDDVSLDNFKDATIAVLAGASVLGVAALAFLPQNIGATLCYFIALVPIIWVGVGSSTPAILAGIILFFSGDSEDKEVRDDRICRHEAGHFLCGYLCGLPIKSYSITSETGFPCVEFHASSDGKMERELASEEVAVLSVVSMS